MRSATRYLGFDRDFVTHTLEKRGEIGVALELAFRHGLRDKLLRSNVTLAGTPVTP